MGVGEVRRGRLAGDGAGPDFLARRAPLSGERADGGRRERGRAMRLPTGASRFVFIFAHPAGHVGAPRHYTPCFQGNGLDWHMVPLDIAPEHLSEAIRTLAKSPSVAGFTLTM